jgi:ATP-dependent DNA helicase PIF1
VLPWEEYEAGLSSTTSKQSRSNFHELSGPGAASKLAGVKGQMLMSTSMDIKQKVLLSPEQQMVHKLVVDDGKSVFFTGSAGENCSTLFTSLVHFGTHAYFCREGTGKSVLLREIISSLKRKHRGNADAVAVTASTGMAACNIGGTTIHSFAGIGIGNDSAQKLIDKVRKNRNANAKWQRCKVLVIDEGEASPFFASRGRVLIK